MKQSNCFIDFEKSICRKDEEDKNVFKKAIPLWIQNRENEIHLRVQFKTLLEYAGEGEYYLKLATSGIYQVYVNGKFVSYGPARAGKATFCVEELEITDWMEMGRNAIVIEVCGYNATSFYIQKQSSFLTAEVCMEDEPVKWTGEHFSARINPNYIQKTQRYSYQRPMIENYRIRTKNHFMNDNSEGTEVLSKVSGGDYIKRCVPYPQFEEIEAVEIAGGKIESCAPQEYFRDRSIRLVGEELSGFSLEELEEVVTDECQSMHFVRSIELLQGEFQARQYAIYELPYNATGMVKFSVNCLEDVTIYFMFDEVLKDEQVDFLRMRCANTVKYTLPKGRHELQFFEVYTMKYIQVAVIEGTCTLEDLRVIEYKHPPVLYDTSCYSAEIKQIADAAIETYRQNSVDLFMDCPSRERAGWLCDSFFTARTECCLTGQNVIERQFLENFLCEDNYAGLPEGMLPMCYPADHLTGEFIPNWALWFIIELDDYVTRTGDREFVEKFHEKIQKLLRYFEKFENEDGLLEKLEGWIFVEWSMANELVQDVNYPTNMLYYAALHAASRILQTDELNKKAERIKEKILRQSYDGLFFQDNAVREDGVLTLTGKYTEVCQYYAFFFGIATKESHPQLYEILLNEFGPQRNLQEVYPEVYPANAFIGNYLRIDILMQYGEYDKAKEDIVDYFGYMADRTGTLWEYVGINASCNHGFASYVICWLDQMKAKCS